MKESESERKKEKNEVFVKKESYGEYKEVREMKRMNKKKKLLVTFGENEKAGTHLMAKLRVV